MVKWIDEDNKKGWKLGWYIVIIKNYIIVCDVIEMEYVSELGKVYKVNVRIVWKMEFYDFMLLYVGYQIFMIKLLKLVYLFLLNGSGWKVGQYGVEVQVFDLDRDEIIIIYKRELIVVYIECVI